MGVHSHQNLRSIELLVVEIEPETGQKLPSLGETTSLDLENEESDELASSCV
jgi:hypothetical protein